MTRLGKTVVSPVPPEAITSSKILLILEVLFHKRTLIQKKNSTALTFQISKFKVHQGRWNFKKNCGDKPIWWAHRIDYFPWPWSIHSQSCPIFIERSDKHQQILCDVITERMNNDCWVSNSSLQKSKVIHP